MRSRSESTRARIIDAAERHLRSYGHAKTTVADIAAACRMSPANVYRFFDSKSDLIGAVAERWLGELEALAAEIAARPAPPSDRLRDYLLEIHDFTRQRLISEARIHETCAMASVEQWPVVRSHLRRMRDHLERIIADGVAAGAFAVEDVAGAAETARNAMIKFHHPAIVGQYEHQALREQAERMAVLILRALARPPGPNGGNRRPSAP